MNKLCYKHEKNGYVLTKKSNFIFRRVIFDYNDFHTFLGQ